MTTKVTGIDAGSGQPISIEIADGRITTIAAGVPGEDRFLSAGLVDLQVNGYAGIDLNAGVPGIESISSLARQLLAMGVTGFCPTLITASREALLQRLRAIAGAIEADERLAAMVAGIHVEGPFIAPEDGPRGAHPPEHVRPPDFAEFAAWQEAAGGRITILTLSPHWPGASAFIEKVTRENVKVAIGHTGASAEAITAAVDAGAVLSTHLGNGAAAVLPRHPNFIWTQLADDRLTASFIADGHHLPGDTLKVMLRAKGLERAVLVSDTAALGGMPPGLYDAPIGGRVEVSPQGKLGVHGTPYLAGAWRNLNEDVALATGLAGLSLAQALRLATVNPGRFAGGRGRLEVGAPADLIRFRFAAGDNKLSITDVFLAGERVGS